MDAFTTISAIDAKQQSVDNAVALVRALTANLRAGMKIDAIKTMRTHTECGLKEAKDLVEALIEVGQNYHRANNDFYGVKRERVVLVRNEDTWEPPCRYSSFPSEAMDYARERANDSYTSEVLVAEVIGKTTKVFKEC